MIRNIMQDIVVQRRSISLLSKLWNGPQSTTGGIEAEKRMQDILKKAFPEARTVQVADVSGGCGAMYEILVESAQFKGLSIIKQHRLVNEALKEEIKEMHGLRIHTSHTGS